MRFRQVACARCGKRGNALHRVKHDVSCLRESLRLHELAEPACVRQFGHPPDLSHLRAEIAQREANA